MAGIVRLDTHVVVWLYAGSTERLTPFAADLIESELLTISPMVGLELAYLHEVGRLAVEASSILNDLSSRIGLELATTPFAEVVRCAMSLTWTRDPFDRLIVADAIAARVPLLTADETIRKQTSIAVW